MESASTGGDWLTKGNLAKAADIDYFNSINLPIVVNILPIGFNKNGNLALHIKQQEMVEWLSHLDHVVPHVVINSESRKNVHVLENAADINYKYEISLHIDTDIVVDLD